MSTIDKIKEDAERIMQKARAGHTLTKDEIAILKIATPQGKAGNAGKRKVIRTGK